jgi:SAM-dependent methyltransferase
METWKFFDITHKEHVLCNPTSLAKFSRLVELVRLPQGARVLEIATGKGELMVQLAERYGVAGVAIDLSPYCIADAQRKIEARVPGAEIELLHMDGAAYQPKAGEFFDLAACLGASWIFNGHKGTLAALAEMTKPGGLVVVGEPYWRQEPHPDYLAAADLERALFGTHYENVTSGEEVGLALLYTLDSNLDEWDQYEGLQWYAAENYAAGQPEDPDVPELLQRVYGDRQSYLQWGRDTLGWAIYLFRK